MTQKMSRPPPICVCVCGVGGRHHKKSNSHRTFLKKAYRRALRDRPYRTYGGQEKLENIRSAGTYCRPTELRGTPNS